MPLLSRSARRLPAGAAALLVAGALAGCGPTGPQAALAQGETTAGAQPVAVAPEDLDDPLVWVGTVTAYDGLIDDMLVLDYGGPREARVDLAHVQPVRDGDCVGVGEGWSAAYTEAIHRRVPLGSRIALVRWQEKGGRPKVEDKGYVHFLGPDGTPLLDQPSLNEEMVRDGIAAPDPDVDLTGRPYSRSPLEVLEEQRERLSALDFAYWSRFAELYQRAWTEGTGPAGACAAEFTRQEREAAQERREAEERYRETERRLALERERRRAEGATHGGSGGSYGGYGGGYGSGRRSCDGDGDGVCYE